uniref:Coiled-coil-helix-coiled-coil-helix domain-containing protein 7 n=3 Tax=Paridae TaxID=9153 RepID=A0A8C0V097_CYACU
MGKGKAPELLGGGEQANSFLYYEKKNFCPKNDGKGGSSAPKSLRIPPKPQPPGPGDTPRVAGSTGEISVRNLSGLRRYEYLSRMSRHAKKLRDHDINPCIAETDATTKCMNDNNYNKDLCTDYFLKYKNCRKFWHEIMMQRKRSGVKPEMPPAEERKKILDSMGKLY